MIHLLDKDEEDCYTSHMIDGNRNTHYSENDIKQSLRHMKSLVEQGKFTVSLGYTKDDNREFLDNYHLLTNDIKNLLLKIEYSDFCYTTRSINERYFGKPLYVFAPVYELYNCNDEMERIQTYVKLDIVVKENGEEVVAISFHSAHEPIAYNFSR